MKQAKKSGFLYKLCYNIAITFGKENYCEYRTDDF